MKVGFIGLGNVGSKLSGSLLRNKVDLYVHDLNRDLVQKFKGFGANIANSPRKMMNICDVVITCLPSPSISASVMEGADGLLNSIKPSKVWMEMSTTDEAEVKRLGALVKNKGGQPVDCPVSGGCHRADTGNISIFAGCERETFEFIFPLLTVEENLMTGFSWVSLNIKSFDKLPSNRELNYLFRGFGSSKGSRNGFKYNL